MQFTVTTNFAFDRLAVMKSIDEARERAGMKIGAFVRRSAKTKLNKSGRRNGPSKPGEAPRKHRGDLRELVTFGLDQATKKVVVGPLPFNAVYFGDDGRPVRGTVPSVLEYGGSISIAEEKYPDWIIKEAEKRGLPGREWRRIDQRKNRTNWPKRIRKVDIAARPYMLPSLMENVENGKLAQAWENILK